MKHLIRTMKFLAPITFLNVNKISVWRYLVHLSSSSSLTACILANVKKISLVLSNS